MNETLVTGRAILERSHIFTGVTYASYFFLAVFLSLLVLLFVTVLLRMFFKHHPMINRAHRVLIYLLTMTGVAALLLAGMMGLLLPIIPGIPLILAALFLMRKYHKVPWIEKVILYFKHKVRHFKRKRKEKVNKMSKRSKRRG